MSFVGFAITRDDPAVPGSESRFSGSVSSSALEGNRERRRETPSAARDAPHLIIRRSIRLCCGYSAAIVMFHDHVFVAAVSSQIFFFCVSSSAKYYSGYCSRSPPARTGIRGLPFLRSIQVPRHVGRRSVQVLLLPRRLCNLIQIQGRGTAFRRQTSLQIHLGSCSSGSTTIDHPKRMSLTQHMDTISSDRELFKLLKAIHPRHLHRFYRSSRPRCFDYLALTVDACPHSNSPPCRCVHMQLGASAGSPIHVWSAW